MDLQIGARVRLKPYPEIKEHIGDYWGREGWWSITSKRPWIKEFAGRAFSVSSLGDGHVRLIGSPYGAFWVKETAIKEVLR